MKIKLSIIAAMTLLTMAAFSQSGNDLVFNQVLLVSSVQTVPANRVWKVESILPSTRLTTSMCNTSGVCATSSTQQIILVNGSNVFMASSDATMNASYSVANSMSAVHDKIFWLPAGASLAASSGVLSVSVLEFLVIPKP